MNGACRQLKEAKAFTEDQFDAILLDLSLPDSQGLDTIERMSEMLPQLPLVILTGLTDGHVAAEAVREGAGLPGEGRD